MGHLGLKVAPYLRTSATHIYAAGDAAGNAQLTPVAAYEGRLAAAHASSQENGQSKASGSRWGKLACHLGLHYRCDAY